MYSSLISVSVIRTLPKKYESPSREWRDVRITPEPETSFTFFAISRFTKLMLTLVSAFNEFERSIVKERQREGIELAKKRGAFKGGVCRISDEKVSHMKHLLKEGVLLAKVSRIFGISRTSAYRYLECGKSKE